MISPQLVSGDALSADEVYAVWKIRDAVFAVEQQCGEPDVDGIDLLPLCSHLWFADDDGLTSYLRTFTTELGRRRVGRVATRADMRGRGLAGCLLDEVIKRWPDSEIELGAQAYLLQWYASYGFRRSGDNYVEASIEHVPMLRQPQSH